MSYFKTPQEAFREGMKQLDAASLKAAYPFFRQAYHQEQEAIGGKGPSSPSLKGTPEIVSYYGLCLALEDLEVQTGLRLARWALSQQRDNWEFHLNLAKIYIRDGNRETCFKHLTRAERLGKNPPSVQAFWEEIGIRRTPVLPFLSRSNPVNKYLGMLRHKMEANGH